MVILLLLFLKKNKKPNKREKSAFNLGISFIACKEINKNDKGTDGKLSFITCVPYCCCLMTIT